MADYQMTTIGDLIPAIPWVAQENQRFITMLRGLSEEDWRQPTHCTGWTAADVVAHMTLGARFYAHVIPPGSKGLLEMPFGAGDLKEFWDYRDRVGKELAGLPGQDRIDTFEAAVNYLQAVFEAIRPENMNKEAWHWMCPCPIHSFPGQRLYELILHDWDIRNNPESDLHPAALGMATDILDFRLPFFYNLTPDPYLSGSFRFETDEPRRIWGLGIENTHAKSIPGKGEGFDVRLFSSASDLLLLTTGRASLSEKIKQKHLVIDGDRIMGETLMRVLCQPF